MRRSAVATRARAGAPALTRDIHAARAAFDRGDAELSRAAHALRDSVHEEPPGATGPAAAAIHGGSSVPSSLEPGHAGGERSIRKGFVYAGVDGLATACTLFALCAVLDLDRSRGLRLLFGGVVGAAVGAALREYGRTRARNSEYAHERAREAWELANFEEGEVKEMRELYALKGMSTGEIAVLSCGQSLEWCCGRAQ